MHYYDKIGVAVVELDGSIALGDRIHFKFEGSDLFEQIVDEIQIEHEKKETAGRGEIIGLKIKEPVKEGTEIYKI